MIDFDSLQDDSLNAPVKSEPTGDLKGRAPAFDSLVDDEEKYGSLGQQAITGLEGAAQGVIGPLAPAAERFLGVPTQDIRARAETNPITHGVGEAVGFGGSLLAGAGEAKIVGSLGEMAAKAAGVGLEGASTISKIASHGIQTGAEMAALQASDEVSKMILQDPNQSLGTAAINVGLSGLMGGVGGAAIGTISPLWKASVEKMGVPKLLDDAKAQYRFRQALPSGDVPTAITEELTGRMGEVDALREQMSNLKGSALERAMPEMTAENSAKIDAQVQDISNTMTKSIDKASDNAYLKGAVPKLQQDFQEFLEKVTDPNASFSDKFDAIDSLKRSQQAKARYNLTAEDTALGSFTKSTARDLRLALEDSQVWGEAAEVQKKVNSAIKASIDAEKDAASKFTSKMLGDRVADPNKVNTLVNQSLKGKAGLKTDIMRNYLDNTQALADTINEIHTSAGLEAPIRLTPTAALDHTLGRSSPGTTLGNWLYDKGLASVAGHVGGEAIGAGLGSLVGHPIMGALAGEKMLAPAITSIAKPLMETASHSEAFKGSLEYVLSVMKGERLLNKATQNFFKAGFEVLPPRMIPDMASREKLEKSIEYASNPENAMKIGGNLGHYLPAHATAAGATAATAINHLKSLKPVKAQASPLDKPAPINKMKQQQYQRALSISQQPLMILQYAKNGTLQNQDISTLQQIYPNLHAKMVDQVYQNMVKTLADGHDIPYKQRQSLSLLMGKPMDSTLTTQSMQAIMAANAPKTPQQAPQSQKKPSRATANSMQKTNKMYATPDQARAASRTTNG